MTGVFATVLWLAFAYLLGTVSWSYLLVRKMRGIDLRTVGSGNLGATNAGRVLGRKYAVMIYVFDLIKGLTAVLPARYLFDAAGVGPLPLPHIAGLAVIIGHVYPFWLGFKGGKGVATGSGVVFALAPLTGLLSVVIWLLLLGAFRMVSVSSIIATASLPLLHLRFGDGERVTTWFLAAIALFVCALHRQNVVRILRGTENKIGGKR